jgi:hypothetical protein
MGIAHAQRRLRPDHLAHAERTGPGASAVTNSYTISGSVAILLRMREVVRSHQSQTLFPAIGFGSVQP